MFFRLHEVSHGRPFGTAAAELEVVGNVHGISGAERRFSSVAGHHGLCVVARFGSIHLSQVDHAHEAFLVRLHFGWVSWPHERIGTLKERGP